MNKVWLIIGLCGLCLSFFLLMIPGYAGGGIIIMALSIWAIYYGSNRKSRESVSSDTYEKMLFIRECSALCKKSEEYLKEMEEDLDYIALKELYGYLPALYNEYASTVLNAPLQLTKPVSPYSAAQLGTMMGGVAVGLVAAHNAIEKQKAYEKNVKDVISSNLRIGNACDKVTYCYSSIEAILEKRESTKADWQSEKDAIKMELDSQYKISSLL